VNTGKERGVCNAIPGHAEARQPDCLTIGVLETLRIAFRLQHINLLLVVFDSQTRSQGPVAYIESILRIVGFGLNLDSQIFSEGTKSLGPIQALRSWVTITELSALAIFLVIAETDHGIILNAEQVVTEIQTWFKAIVVITARTMSAATLLSECFCRNHTITTIHLGTPSQ